MTIAEHTSSYGQAFQELLNISPEDLAHCNIAEMNLLCAQGLPGAENLNIPQMLGTLQEWATVVKQVTESELPRLMSRPQHMTESQIRMWFIIRVLRDKFGVHHRDNPRANMVERMGPKIGLTFEELGYSTSDFADAQAIFIHGLLGPERVGTCSSLPVLYAAVGRRLGYPAKIATNTAHVFNRWEDQNEVFNIEGTSFDYINIHPDEQYIDACGLPWSDYERYNNYLVRGKTAAEELSLCLSLRGSCLMANNRLDEALECYTACWRLMPANEREASNMRAVLKSQFERYKKIHTTLPTNPHFNVQEGQNQIIAIAPRRTQAALFAARGIRLAFECQLDSSREAFAIACRLTPDDVAYSEMMSSVEVFQWRSLPPSNCIRAGIKAGEQADEFVRQRKGQQAVTRLARAHRLHPRATPYWCKISHLVRINRPGCNPIVVDTVSGRPAYSEQDVAWLLSVNGDEFLKQGELVEARWAFEEALHLMPRHQAYRDAINEVTRQLHEAARVGKGQITRKVGT